MNDDPHATDAGNLQRAAQAARDATWDDEQPTDRARVPGVLSGELGPKGRIAARHRTLGRTRRGTGSADVPRGSSTPGGGLMLLGTMLALGIVLLVVVALIIWAMS